jgi:hypothetical protein
MQATTCGQRSTRMHETHSLTHIHADHDRDVQRTVQPAGAASRGTRSPNSPDVVSSRDAAAALLALDACLYEGAEFADNVHERLRLQERAQVANKRADELQKEKERKKRESAALAQTSAVRAALIRCASSQTGNACAHMPRLAALSKSGLPKLENACSAVVLFCWWCWCELVPTSVRSCA